MKRIGIIGAMEIEVEQLKERMDIKSVKRKAGMEFCEGTYGSNDVVIVRSGIGKVNAAICTQILVDCYNVQMVINTGIAGGLYTSINIGDIVLATDALQHDMDATGFGYKKGVIPQMDTSVFCADERLRKMAADICRSVNPDISVYEGRVISGDCFVSDNDKKKELWDLFKGYCTEMEGRMGCYHEVVIADEIKTKGWWIFKRVVGVDVKAMVMNPNDTIVSLKSIEVSKKKRRRNQ